MNGCKGSIPPKILGNVDVKKKATCGVKDVTKFAFSYTVLLWCVWTSGFMNNAMALKEGGEGRVNVITGIVRAKATDGGRELSLDERVKLGNNGGNIRFVFYKVSPREPSCVVNKYSQPPRARGTMNRGWTPNITVNKRK